MDYEKPPNKSGPGLHAGSCCYPAFESTQDAAERIGGIAKATYSINDQIEDLREKLEAEQMKLDDALIPLIRSGVLKLNMTYLTTYGAVTIFSSKSIPGGAQVFILPYQDFSPPAVHDEKPF